MDVDLLDALCEKAKENISGIETTDSNDYDEASAMVHISGIEASDSNDYDEASAMIHISGIEASDSNDYDEASAMVHKRPRKFFYYHERPFGGPCQFLAFFGAVWHIQEIYCISRVLMPEMQDVTRSHIKSWQKWTDSPHLFFCP
jgi:hypothetical protein